MANVKVDIQSEGRKTTFPDGREVCIASAKSDSNEVGWAVEFVDRDGDKLPFFVTHEALVALFQMFGYIYGRDSGFKVDDV